MRREAAVGFARWPRGIRVLAAVAVIWAGTLPTQAAAQPKADRAALAGVFADWQTRQKAFKTARYVVSGTLEFLKPLSPLSPPAPPAAERTKPYTATVLIDLERKRFRFEVTHFVPRDIGGFQKRVGTVTYDGVEKRQHSPREVAEAIGGFDLLIAKGAKEGEQGIEALTEMLPLFFHHGIVSTVHQPPYLERLPLSWPADDFVLRGRLPLQGVNCLVVRTEPFNGANGLSDEYWIHPERKSAILRYVYLTDGQPWFRHDIEWAEGPAGWQPKKWTMAQISGGTDVSRLYTLTVTHAEMNPAVTDAEFTVPAVPGMKKVIVAEPPPPGTRVHPGYPGQRVYEITADGEWVEFGSQGWKSLDGQTDIPLPGRTRWWWWVVGAVSVVFGGWVVLRWRKRGPTPPRPCHTEEDEG